MSKTLDTGVFERTGHDEMSRRAFYLVLGTILAWGFYATSIVADMTATWQPSLWMILLVGLGIPILGILISASDSPVISFIGYHLVVIPFGATLGPLLHQYELTQPGVVASAAQLTALVTGVMALSGVLFPNFYSGLGRALFSALVCLLVVRILQMFIPALAAFKGVDYFSAGLFALYIGYDMYRASEIPATLDNAVDVAIALYLDIINLFLSILRINKD